MNKLINNKTNITILVVSGATMMTFASVVDPLRAANRLSQQTPFHWRLTSPQGETVSLTGGLEFPVNAKLRSSDSGHLLIIIASFDHQKSATPELIRTLRQVAQNFDHLCGVEAGSWLLARAGLITNHKVTTHWEDLESLQQAYPEAIVSDERFVMDRNIWTCGGASPAFDMMLHLIEQRCSPQLAIEVASVFVYDQLHTASAKQPSASLGTLEQNQPKVAAAIRLMEKNIEAPVSTEAIAKRVGVSLKTLETLFRSVLHETPGAYYLIMRLQMARKLVTDTQLSLQEIAVRTGFNSQSAFSRSFRRTYRTSASSLRNQRQPM